MVTEIAMPNKKSNKIIQLKNRITNDVIYTRNIDDIVVINGVKFLRAFNNYQPQRSFLVNLEAYSRIS